MNGEVFTRTSIDLKEDDALDETAPATVPSLLEAATETMEVLLEAIESVCAVYEVDFRDVLGTREDAMVELLEKKLILF